MKGLLLNRLQMRQGIIEKRAITVYLPQIRSMKFYPFILSFASDSLVILPTGIYLIWLSTQEEMMEGNLVMGLGLALMVHLLLKYSGFIIREKILTSANQALTFALVVFLMLGILFNLSDGPALLILTNLCLLAATGLNIKFLQEWKKGLV